jgi:hypothetical protein
MIGICKYSKQCIFRTKALYFDASLFVRQLTCLTDYDLKGCIEGGNSKSRFQERTSARYDTVCMVRSWLPQLKRHGVWSGTHSPFFPLLTYPLWHNPTPWILRLCRDLTHIQIWTGEHGLGRISGKRQRAWIRQRVVLKYPRRQIFMKGKRTRTKTGGYRSDLTVLGQRSAFFIIWWARGGHSRNGNRVQGKAPGSLLISSTPSSADSFGVERYGFKLLAPYLVVSKGQDLTMQTLPCWLFVPSLFIPVKCFLSFKA